MLPSVTLHRPTMHPDVTIQRTSASARVWLPIGLATVEQCPHGHLKSCSTKGCLRAARQDVDRRLSLRFSSVRTSSPPEDATSRPKENRPCLHPRNELPTSASWRLFRQRR